MEGPKLLHIKTKKGKGFKPAEKSATEWHAPGLFNKETGERIIVHKLNEPSFIRMFSDIPLLSWPNRMNGSWELLLPCRRAVP